MWISFTKFELTTSSEDCVEKARGIYKEANESLRNTDEKEERMMLLEAWKDFEVNRWIHLSTLATFINFISDGTLALHMTIDYMWPSTTKVHLVGQIDFEVMNEIVCKI